MAEIESLDDIESLALPTETQLRSLIHKVDVTIFNIVSGNGTYGGMDIREGDHSSNPTSLLAELRRIRKMWVDALNDPDQNPESIAIFITEWDNPDIPLNKLGLCL